MTADPNIYTVFEGLKVPDPPRPPREDRDETPQPGEDCPTCKRRVQKPRQTSSPDTKVISIGRLPVDRAELLQDALDGLVEVTGAKGHSYPRGALLEGLVLLGGQHREQLRSLFTGDGS